MNRQQTDYVSTKAYCNDEHRKLNNRPDEDRITSPRSESSEIFLKRYPSTYNTISGRSHPNRKEVEM